MVNAIGVLLEDEGEKRVFFMAFWRVVMGWIGRGPTSQPYRAFGRILHRSVDTLSWYMKSPEANLEHMGTTLLMRAARVGLTVPCVVEK